LPSSLQEVSICLGIVSADRRVGGGRARTTGRLAQLAEAVDAGIVESDGGAITFVHPVYRSAIYADASRAHRHRVHRRLSAVVEEDARGR
jgi:hypothetical protein